MIITLFILITAIGILNTIYLSYISIKGIPVRCYFFPQDWCNKVTQSKYSRTLGIPNPFLGLFMLTLILVLFILFINSSVSFLPVRILVVGGFLFSMYFLYIQAFVIKAFCTWCVVSAIVFSLLFILQFSIPG